MSQHIASLAILVREYDEAIQWYCGILGFGLVEDTRLTDTKRWVRVAPVASSAFSLLLARAVTPEQSSRIGNQTGGRVFLFLNTDDFWRDYHALSSRGVVFRRSPVEEPYGTVAVFEDLRKPLGSYTAGKRRTLNSVRRCQQYGATVSADNRCVLKNTGCQSFLPFDLDLRTNRVAGNAFGKQAPRNLLGQSYPAIHFLRVFA